MTAGAIGASSYWSIAWSTSALVAGSGAVGPEAIVSSGIADHIREDQADDGGPIGQADDAAALEPVQPAAQGVDLVYAAPQASSVEVSVCISSKGKPSIGAETSADPPPEMRQMSRSSGWRPERNSTDLFACFQAALVREGDVRPVGWRWKQAGVAMELFGDDQPGPKTIRKDICQGSRHRNGGLAYAEKEDAGGRMQVK